MAKAVISNVQDTKVSFMAAANYPIATIKNVPHKSIITDVPKFRVKFVNIGVPGYSPNNPAPIGIAVIGLNNWIL